MFNDLNANCVIDNDVCDVFVVTMIGNHTNISECIVIACVIVVGVSWWLLFEIIVIDWYCIGLLTNCWCYAMCTH